MTNKTHPGLLRRRLMPPRPPPPLRSLHCTRGNTQVNIHINR